MKKILVLCGIYLFSMSSCSTSNGDESNIRSLITSWTQVNPNSIGGPSELKDVTQIEEIKINNLHESRFAKLGCKDCKEAEVELNCLTIDKKRKDIIYQLRNFEGYWEITAWEVVGGEKGGCYPLINMEVINARKEINPNP